MRKLLVIFSLIFMLGFLLIPWVPVYAISNPDSISIEDVAVFRNVLESGDQLFCCRYNIHYTSTPSESVSSAFSMYIYDGDTQTGFSRNLNYYEENIISIYLDSGDALTWDYGYSIKVMGNIGLFGALIEGTNMVTKGLSSGDYYEDTDLGDFVIAQALLIDTDWVTNGLLNTTGAFYMSKAIPGLVNMAPEVFTYGSIYPGSSSNNWTTSGGDTMSAHSGSLLNEALVGIGGILGIPGGSNALYEYFDSGDFTYAPVYDNWWICQTFTPEESHSLSRIDLKLYKVGTPGTLIVAVYDTSGGGPTGYALITYSLDGSTLTEDTDGEWVECSLSSSISLTPPTNIIGIVTFSIILV